MKVPKSSTGSKSHVQVFLVKFPIKVSICRFPAKSSQTQRFNLAIFLTSYLAFYLAFQLVFHLTICRGKFLRFSVAGLWKIVGIFAKTDTPQVAASGCKWPQVAASGRKWPQVAASGRKTRPLEWPQVAARPEIKFRPLCTLSVILG